MNLNDFLKKYQVLKNIKRFSMEDATRPQNLCEHGYGTANLFYLLCVQTNTEVSSEDLFLVMNHDFAEAFTGDLNHVVKNKSSKTELAWSTIEREVLGKELRRWSDKGLCLRLTKEQKYLFKLSDKLDALLYCLEEIKRGNQNFIPIFKIYSDSILSCIDKSSFRFKKDLKFLRNLIVKESNLIKRRIK